MEKYLVFHVEGGLGKNIGATSVLPALKSKYKDRKLVVMASWPEVFLNNPHIHRVYRLGATPYFWDEYVKNSDTLFMRREPYFESGHITQKDNLIKTWHKMYDLEYKEGTRPEIYMNMMQAAYPQMWRREKPIMVLHTSGGPMGDGQPVYSWTRDIPQPLSHDIVNKFNNQYHIIQVCKDQSQAIQHPSVEVVFRPMSNYELFSLLLVSAKRVLIDSCLQHAAAAFNLPSTVLWIGTKKQVFGYDLHNNISANKPKEEFTKLPDSVYFDFQLGGLYHECPYMSPDEMFDVKKVLDEIEKF